MDTTISPGELASDFRFALDVIEESNHLGLDDEHARLLRDILQRRIEKARAAFSETPTANPGQKVLHPFPLPVDSDM